MRGWAFNTGLAIVVGTHIYMLNSALPEAMRKEHAYLNLGAAALILWSVNQT
jgi:hypothetical protein